jgi:uncharacterized protein
MAHPNEELIRRLHDAFTAGDMDTIRAAHAPDAVRHVPGRGPLAGDLHGPDELLGWFARLAQASNGTVRLDLHDVVANDAHAVALQVLRAQRGHRTLEERAVNVYHLRGGKIQEAWTFVEDLYAVEEFWS